MRKDDEPRPPSPKTKFSTTLEDGTVKSIELPAPSSMRVCRTATLVSGDITTEQDLVKITLMMFNEPEVAVEYFSEYQKQLAPLLKAAIDRGDILLLKSENYYYKHHRHDRVYVLVPPSIPGVKDAPQWKRKLVETSPPFVKNTLSLSERKKREYELYQKIEMEEAFREERRTARYTYDVFLSYSEKDTSIAFSIRDELLRGGARVFMAQKSLRPGDDFAEEIRLSLHGSAEVWVILSPHSLTSEWVTTEWGAAWVLDKKIVPILHRCDTPQIPERLRRLHCIDAAAVGVIIKERLASTQGLSGGQQ
jgi:hypothetical protein